MGIPICLDPEGIAQNIGQTASTAITVVTGLLSDPNLPAFLDRLYTVMTLPQQEQAAAGGGTGGALGDFILPMDLYIFARRHPAIAALGGAAVFVLPLLLGYSMARRRYRPH